MKKKKRKGRKRKRRGQGPEVIVLKVTTHQNQRSPRRKRSESLDHAAGLLTDTEDLGQGVIVEGQGRVVTVEGQGHEVTTVKTNTDEGLDLEAEVTTQGQEAETEGGGGQELLTQDHMIPTRSLEGQGHIHLTRKAGKIDLLKEKIPV